MSDSVIATSWMDADVIARADGVVREALRSTPPICQFPKYCSFITGVTTLRRFFFFIFGLGESGWRGVNGMSVSEASVEETDQMESSEGYWTFQQLVDFI